MPLAGYPVPVPKIRAAHRREERTALDPGGAGLLSAGLPADRPGRLGAGFPAGSKAGRPIRAPARTRAAVQPGQAGWRVGTLAGSVQEEKARVVSMEAVAPLVALVALPISIALFGWLIYRLLRPGRRR
jgi:hypothetical protein